VDRDARVEHIEHQAKKEKIVFASDAEMRAYKAPFELTDPYKGSTRLSSFTIR
jgi:hypothetical protein